MGPSIQRVHNKSSQAHAVLTRLSLIYAVGSSASVLDHLFSNMYVVYVTRRVVSLSAIEVSATYTHHQPLLVITTLGRMW